MNNIILSVIQNKQMCIDELKSFFTQDNIEEVKNFLVYMRNRDLTEEKSKKLHYLAVLEVLLLALQKHKMLTY